MDYVTQALSLFQCKDLPYYSELEKINGIMQSMFIDFPFDFCNLTARVVSIRTGLMEVAGEVWDSELQRRMSHDKWHAWNYDPDNDLNVCLTLYQYNFRLPNISLYSTEIPLFQRIEYLTDFQRNVDLTSYGLDDVLSELQKEDALFNQSSNSLIKTL